MQAKINAEIAPIERPDTLKDLAYHGIKHLLISGKFENQTVYSANQLAETLQVSRTPVREALMQLTSEGFLRGVEGKGFKIRDFSSKDIKDFFETRKIIETHVLESLVNILTAEDFGKLGEYLKKMISCAESDDAYGFLEADKAFHLYLIDRHQNSYLQAIMDNIRNLISIIGHRTIVHQGRYQEVILEHQNLFDALRQKNKTKAVKAILYHLDTTEKYLGIQKN